MIVAFCNVATHLLCVIRTFCLPRLRGEAVRVWKADDHHLQSMAVSDDDNVFVVANCRVLVFSPDGALLRKWGSFGSAAGQFEGPWGIAVAPSGEVVVSDWAGHRVQVFRTDGTFVRAWGSNGVGNGQFKFPTGVAVTPSGAEVIVTDEYNHRVQVFRLADGAFVRQWGEHGSADGQFNYPAGVCITTHGEVLLVPCTSCLKCTMQVVIADKYNYRIQVFTLAGTFLRQWGFGNLDSYQSKLPSDVAVRGNKVLVANTNNRRVHVHTLDGMLVCAWECTIGGRLGDMSGLAVTRKGQVVVADYSKTFGCSYVHVFE